MPLALKARPLPLRHPEDVEHLAGAARGELRIPHCRLCDSTFWPAGPVCPLDRSRDLDWVTDPGTGTVTSWVRFHKPYYADDTVPYVVVQVRLASGPRLTTSWAGGEIPVCGERVEVRFRALGDGATVAEFGPC
ncbi:Zn-ribbon domain-containing OB-fold protein [Pseudonocardia dioxanivorans]|uniref:Zn-ribbon domain-containing OB-fold protein n=1 Tax=Pseudonocardia dioxanivorans TaxID=240495 RepID=UPI000CD0B19E